MISKAEAHYVDGPVTMRPCRWCKYRITGRNTCQLVRGMISEYGTCDHWERALRFSTIVIAHGHHGRQQWQHGTVNWHAGGTRQRM